MENISPCQQKLIKTFQNCTDHKKCIHFFIWLVKWLKMAVKKCPNLSFELNFQCKNYWPSKVSLLHKSVISTEVAYIVYPKTFLNFCRPCIMLWTWQKHWNLQKNATSKNQFTQLYWWEGPFGKKSANMQVRKWTPINNFTAYWIWSLLNWW